MGLLDDVRDFAEHPPTHTEACPDGYQQICGVCNRRVDRGHESGCFTLVAPKIVAALEAAERLAHEHEPTEFADESGRRGYVFCGRYVSRGHAPDCPWQALVAALKGES